MSKTIIRVVAVLVALGILLRGIAAYKGGKRCR